MSAPKPKKAREMTTDEAMERLFGKKALDEARKLAAEPVRKSKKSQRKPSKA
jgi:hypothetical protein